MYEVKVSSPCYKQTNEDKKAAVNVGTAAQKICHLTICHLTNIMLNIVIIAI